jgi:ornithine cyclodeaminase
MSQQHPRLPAGEHGMVVLDDAAVLRLADPAGLVAALKDAFRAPGQTPPRVHGELPGSDDARLLIMPSWSGREAIGVKVLTSVPRNASRGLPTISGVYLLMDGETGQPRAVLNAAALTSLRTAAVGALAASLLARADARVLLVLGTGALAPHLVRAYLAVRPLQRVLVWGRDGHKAGQVVAQLSGLPVRVEVAGALAPAVGMADMICCATAARTPVIKGVWVSEGTHVDLIGSFTPAMREADTELIRRARVVVDVAAAGAESGDLLGPLQEGALSLPLPDLTALLRQPNVGRTDDSQITVFKSIGTGLADLAVARHLVGLLRRG